MEDGSSEEDEKPTSPNVDTIAPKERSPFISPASGSGGREPLLKVESTYMEGEEEVAAQSLEKQHDSHLNSRHFQSNAINMNVDNQSPEGDRDSIGTGHNGGNPSYKPSKDTTKRRSPNKKSRNRVHPLDDDTNNNTTTITTNGHHTHGDDSVESNQTVERKFYTPPRDEAHSSTDSVLAEFPDMQMDPGPAQMKATIELKDLQSKGYHGLFDESQMDNDDVSKTRNLYPLPAKSRRPTSMSRILTRQSKGITTSSRRRSSTGKTMRKISPRRILRNWFHSKDPNPVWRKQIKKIEGKFGAGFAVFFTFVRFILQVNLALVICQLGILIVPAWLDYEVLPVIGIPDGEEFIAENAVLFNETKFELRNVFDGAGTVGESPLFFGGYTARAGSYRMDLAYILLNLTLLIVMLFYLMNKFCSRRKKGSTLVASHKKMPYSMCVLASWDYSLNSKQGVENLKSGITHALNQELRDLFVRNNYGVKDLSRGHLCKRFLGWFAWVIIMAGAFYAIVTALQHDIDNKAEKPAKDRDLFDEYLVAGTVSGMNAVFPFLFKALGAFEDYGTRGTEINVEIARSFLLRALGIYAILYGLIIEFNINDEQFPLHQDEYRISQLNCAGTRIGQEVYKLAIADVTFTVIMETFFYYTAKLVTGDFIEMDIAQSVIILCYRQGLVWIGMIFSPIIPLVGAIGAIVSFYLYKFLAYQTCRPPRKGIRPTSSKFVHIGTLLMMILFCSAPLLYILRVYSPNCGAFPGYTTIFTGLEMWTIEDDKEEWRTFVSLFTEPMVLYTVIFILGALLSYHRAALVDVRWSRKEMRAEVVHLRNELVTRRCSSASTMHSRSLSGSSASSRFESSV